MNKTIIEVIQDARDIAMKQCLVARIPEAGEFGAIAQDLDWAVEELRLLQSYAKEGWRYADEVERKRARLMQELEKFRHVCNLVVDENHDFQVDRRDHPTEQLIPVYKKIDLENFSEQQIIDSFRKATK